MDDNNYKIFRCLQYFVGQDDLLSIINKVCDRGISRGYKPTLLLSKFDENFSYFYFFDVVFYWHWTNLPYSFWAYTNLRFMYCLLSARLCPDGVIPVRYIERVHAEDGEREIRLLTLVNKLN